MKCHHSVLARAIGLEAGLRSDSFAIRAPASGQGCMETRSRRKCGDPLISGHVEKINAVAIWVVDISLEALPRAFSHRLSQEQPLIKGGSGHLFSFMARSQVSVNGKHSSFCVT